MFACACACACACALSNLQKLSVRMPVRMHVAAVGVCAWVWAHGYVQLCACLWVCVLVWIVGVHADMGSGLVCACARVCVLQRCSIM